MGTAFNNYTQTHTHISFFIIITETLKHAVYNQKRNVTDSKHQVKKCIFNSQ